MESEENEHAPPYVRQRVVLSGCGWGGDEKWLETQCVVYYESIKRELKIKPMCSGGGSLEDRVGNLGITCQVFFFTFPNIRFAAWAAPTPAHIGFISECPLLPFLRAGFPLQKPALIFDLFFVVYY